VSESVEREGPAGDNRSRQPVRDTQKARANQLSIDKRAALSHAPTVRFLASLMNDQKLMDKLFYHDARADAYASGRRFVAETIRDVAIEVDPRLWLALEHEILECRRFPTNKIKESEE
jgi:anti-sigma factor RsiW